MTIDTIADRSLLLPNCFWMLDDRARGGLFNIFNKPLYHRTAERMADWVFCHRERSFANAYQSKKSASSPICPASNFFRNDWVERRYLCSNSLMALL